MGERSTGRGARWVARLATRRRTGGLAAPTRIEAPPAVPNAPITVSVAAPQGSLTVDEWARWLTAWTPVACELARLFDATAITFERNFAS